MLMNMKITLLTKYVLLHKSNLWIREFFKNATN